MIKRPVAPQIDGGGFRRGAGGGKPSAEVCAEEASSGKETAEQTGQIRQRHIALVPVRHGVPPAENILVNREIGGEICAQRGKIRGLAGGKNGSIDR